MHYVISHDDGQATRGILEPDVVLVGVSRSSKTPTCFYLANRGFKALSVPLVPGIQPTELLADPPCPVIGLTIDPESLIDIRRHRLKLIGTGAIPASCGPITLLTWIMRLWKRSCSGQGGCAMSAAGRPST